jgi:hypothetical protein
MEFGETIVTKALSEDFTGLRHRIVGPYTTTISCEGVILRLAALLDAYPLAANEKCDWPLPAQAPRVLMEGPSAQWPLAPHLVEAAGPILGTCYTCGFAGGLARPDSYYGYSLLSKHANADRLTTPPAAVGVAEGACHDADIAPGAPLGGGGAIAWRCVAPPAGDDSSAAAELRLATLAYKYVVAARFLQCELEVGAAPAEPTPLYLDAQAVLDGTNCERLAKASRWMAMRYVMLRWGIACGTISPRKLLTAMNPADGLTKCLTGKPFENGRARLLGLPVPHPGL